MDVTDCPKLATMHVVIYVFGFHIHSLSADGWISGFLRRFFQVGTNYSEKADGMRGGWVMHGKGREGGWEVAKNTVKHCLR